jgi:hypothetical protein
LLYGTPKEFHSYSYVQNNPLTKRDRRGLKTECKVEEDNCRTNAYKNFGKCNLKATAFQIACAKTCLIICIPSGYIGGVGYLPCVATCLTGCGVASGAIRYVCLVRLLNDLAKCKA